MKKSFSGFLVDLISLLLVAALPAIGHTADKPNILVIWGDDIGWSSLSAYHRGMLGGSTPNIDRIANEGALFTDYYAQQSCTAGRSAFITGQHPFRTGLLKVGFPGAELGISDKDPTLAELLKPLGYVTGQFGKNHLGDKDKFLPTNHGFDEFFGNLYHMNAEEEPEGDLYPKDPEFRQKYGPRGVIHSYADGRIEDTGPLTSKRMETVDEEFTDAAMKFIDRAHADGKPFFVWYNSTRMHIWTHLSPRWKGKSGYGIYADGMMEHDFHVGQLLDQLDKLGIADNTIVIYSTDNGAQSFTYPDGATVPFRGSKGSTWEGGFRVPALVRWPGVVKPGRVINDIFDHMDWFPTLMSAAGVPDIADKLRHGYTANGKTFKVHLDGYDQTELLQGSGPGTRETVFYFDDSASLNAIRWKDWKINYGIMSDTNGWDHPAEHGRPYIINLRSDPYEKSPDSELYTLFQTQNIWLFVPMQQVVREFVATFQEFPPRQRSDSWSINRVFENISRSASEKK